MRGDVDQLRALVRHGLANDEEVKPTAGRVAAPLSVNLGDYDERRALHLAASEGRLPRAVAALAKHLDHALRSPALRLG